jgi:hypothetical protein
MTKLVDGLIPVGSACPFKDKCELGMDGVCYHTGKFHQSDFSCAIARGFDLVDSVAERVTEERNQLVKELKGGSNGNRKSETLPS